MRRAPGADTYYGIKHTGYGRWCQVGAEKKYSERLFGSVMELLSAAGHKNVTEALGVQENYFSPSKYNYKRFSGKAIGHLDDMEKFFGVDLLGGVESALAREVEAAERAGLLSQHDRKAIRSVLYSAREHAGSRGAAAIEKIRKGRVPGLG